MKEHKDLLREWKARLGLYDWRIVVEDNCRPEDMTLQDCAGCVEWTEGIKTAKIQMIDPRFYGDRLVPFDYEKTLVHELLHLKTSLISSNCGDLQERVTHILIDDLARALVAAKRGVTSL